MQRQLTRESENLLRPRRRFAPGLQPQTGVCSLSRMAAAWACTVESDPAASSEVSCILLKRAWERRQEVGIEVR
jgi:hypothetical protein